MLRRILILLCLGWGVSLQAQEQQSPEPYYIFSIYFGGGSSYIDGEQVKELGDWLDGIPNIETHQISIHSHTDNIGSMEYNKWLSRMRSESAFQELLRKDIPPDIIDIADFGEQSPVYDNRTWEGKLRNRRVDIIIRPLVM